MLFPYLSYHNKSFLAILLLLTLSFFEQFSINTMPNDGTPKKIAAT
jgi:hypothetical protein